MPHTAYPQFPNIITDAWQKPLEAYGDLGAL